MIKSSEIQVFFFSGFWFREMCTYSVGDPKPSVWAKTGSRQKREQGEVDPKTLYRLILRSGGHFLLTEERGVLPPRCSNRNTTHFGQIQSNLLTRCGVPDHHY